MTFQVDPEVLLRAGREAERVASRLRDAGAVLDFGPTETHDSEALARLQRRIHRLASRIGSNGRNLQAFVHDAEAVDGHVSLRLLVLAGRWR